MTRRRKVVVAVLIVLALLVAAVVAVGTWYRPMLMTGTGYAAHNACAIHFLTDRDDPESDLPPNPLVPLLRTEIDDSEGWARSSVLGVAFAQQAWASEYGCAVGEGRAAGSEHTSLVGSQEDRPEGIGLPQATDVPAEVGAALDRAAGQEGTRGLVAVHRGEILDEWYADGFGPDTRQLGWSMAKSVAATLVGRAQQEFPEADLDPADTNLRPEWTDERAQISLDDLLRMTSGLEWDEDYDLGTPITQMLFAEPDMAAFAAAQPLAHEPGTVRQYSSGTTNIVCDLLHERTGLGPEMADRLLFDPLGMTSAVLEADASGRSVCSSYLWATP
ncbi:MAG: serine hydrolase domain-containing protein, partial [Dietzia cercidiphylli]